MAASPTIEMIRIGPHGLRLPSQTSDCDDSAYLQCDYVVKWYYVSNLVTFSYINAFSFMDFLFLIADVRDHGAVVEGRGPIRARDRVTFPHQSLCGRPSQTTA